MEATVALDHRAAATLRTLMRYRELTDRDIAILTGYSRDQVKARKLGQARITVHDLEAFACALGVDPGVLLMPPDDALRRLLAQDGDR
jgi:transcriptional regulator with XRE-family HTH domain